MSVRGKRRFFAGVIAAALCVQAAAIGVASATSSDSVITDRTFVRHDGGTDAAIERCNDNDPATGQANFLANEPSVAIKPDEPTFIVAGANEYCQLEFANWQGVYTSGNGGVSWIDSLVPGYPEDTSSEGRASPAFGRNRLASDPILDWDNRGNLFYGFIAYNPDFTIGDMNLATFRRDPAAPVGVDYLRTVQVDHGNRGHFHDKPALKVDDWSGSPHENNVYVVWAVFGPGRGNGIDIRFSRSTNGASTFSKPMKLSKDVAHENPYAPDVAVAPDGTVYVIWRQYAGFKSGNAIVYVKSTDGGRSFTTQRTLQTITPYDPRDVASEGGYLVSDCGDGFTSCASNFTFARGGSFPQATVDRRGHVYVTWDDVATVPDDGVTYSPDGQARAVVTKSTDGGATWTSPTPIDPQPVGHQFWPNIEVDHSTGRLAAIYMDSRTDASYSPHRPPGNRSDGTSVCGSPVGSSVCNVVNAFIATSGDGTTWTAQRVSSVGYQPQYETTFDRWEPFNGDYIGIDAAGGRVYGAWTDNRDIVPGADPPEEDGFDVLQCRTSPDSPDTCPNAGGLNQNIYGAGID